MKKIFTDWYADQITQVMDAGQEIDSIDIPLKLSIIKPLHANGIIEMYNEMTSAVGREVCLKGWQVAGIKDAVDLGLSSLPSLDPVEDIDPIIRGSVEFQTVGLRGILQASKYVCECGNESDSDADNEEWIDSNDSIDTRNIFETLDAEEEDI